MGLTRAPCHAVARRINTCLVYAGGRTKSPCWAGWASVLHWDVKQCCEGGDEQEQVACKEKLNKPLRLASKIEATFGKVAA
jgi:hypothetical protein